MLIYDCSQGDAGKQSLSRQVLTEEEALACALRWRQDRTRVAVERAGAWMQPPSSPDDNVSVPGPEAALPAPVKGMAADEAGSGSSGMGAAGKPEEGGERLSVPSGFVEVCGVALPKRVEVDAAAAGAQGRGGSLIRTPTVDASLEAAALVLAQGRPLLLEGPPGVLARIMRHVRFDPWGTPACSQETNVAHKGLGLPLIRPLALQMQCCSL